MLETRRAASVRPAVQSGDDQAAGLRRLFGPRQPRWLPVLLANGREGTQGAWLARLARCLVAQGDRTLVVDGARAQVAAALGLRLRFDLQHALDGDCVPQAACVQANEGLWVVPAARGLEAIDRATDAARRFESGVRALAQPVDCVLLVLPEAGRAGQRAALSAFAGAAGYDNALLAIGAGAAAPARCLESMSAAMGVVDIDTFHLLFQDMDTASAGRLFPRLAAVAARELGARIADGGRVADPDAILRLVRALRCRPASGRARTTAARLSEAAENRF
jgi:hypothetical protein